MKKLLSRFLCLVMFLSLFSSEKAAKASQQTEPNGEAEQVCELTEYRTKNSETFLLSDGTRDCVVYTENKYFEDPTGKLVPIDNSIVETPYTEGEREYRYKNAANDTVFYFAETEPAVLVRFQDKSLMYSLIGTKETKAIRGGSECFKQVGEYSLCGENYIAYPNVMEETELVYAVYNGSVKEYIVLNSKSAPTEFSFYFESGEYSIRETENGRPGFYNKAGDLAFELGSLYAVDAAGKYTDQLTYSVKESETGSDHCN